MIKKMFLFVFGLVAITTVALAQTQVAGKVTDEKGSPIDGVTITEKGTNNATATDINGMFKLKLKTQNAKLVFSLQGFTKKEVTVSENMVIKLTPANEELTQVVVTALGIKKEKKSLGTSVSSVTKKDIELNPQTDLGRILQGKAPGLNILATSGLAGSGTNINIRGIATITGNSQPLFVIDGVPFDAGTNTQGNFITGNNQTSRFFDIDPNNIANVEVLKSLAATTLYGELGANGVILITTKTGSGAQSKKKTEITVSHSYNVSQVANLPEYNKTYGGGFDLSVGLAFYSNWGGKFTDPPTLTAYPAVYQNAVAFPQFVGKQYPLKYYNSVENFFRNGLSQTTSINISGGTKGFSYSSNYSYLEEEGFLLGNGTRRNSFSFGGSAALSNKFTLNSTVNFVKSDVKSPPTSTSFGSGSSLTSVYGDVLYTPTGVDLIGLPWENPLDHSQTYYRNANDIQNPIWTLNNSFTRNQTDRVYGNSQIKFEAAKWLNISYRIGFDAYAENTLYAQNKGGVINQLGIYRTTQRNNQIWDHTILGQIKKDINEDMDISADLGYNFREIGYTQQGMLSTQQLVYGLLDHTNFVNHNVNSEGGFDLDRTFTGKSVGYFGTATFGYKQYFYLTAGGRYSTTNRLEAANNSLFFPNASLSLILTEAIKALQGNKNINYLKLRFNVGSTAKFPDDEFVTRQALGIATNIFIDRSGNKYNANANSFFLPNPNLKPELQSDLEFGIESKLLNNKVNLEISLYQKKSIDQILNQPLDPSTGYTSTQINAGTLTNKGFEVNLGVNVIKTKDWNWKIDILHALNVSLVTEMPTNLKRIVTAGYSNLGNIATNDQPLGLIYGGKVKRYNDPNNANNPLNGQRIIGADGNYQYDADPGIIGNPNPLYKSTFISTLTYKNISFRMQWDYTEGGDMYSATAANLLARGVTRDTEFDRAAPVILPGVVVDANNVATKNNYQISATQAYFNNGVGDVGENAVFDATVIRLREASLSYNFSESLLAKTPFGSASIVFSGSNLWYYAPNFPKYVNFDPETSGLGVSNGRGLEFFTGPSSRRYGVSLRLTF